MLAADGLYGHVQRNALKSFALLGAFVVLLAVFWLAWCVIAAAVLDVYLPHQLQPRRPFASPLPVPTVSEIMQLGLHRALLHWWVPVVLAALWFIAAYFIHADLIRAATRARPVTRLEAPRLYNLVENLAISAGLPMPRIQVMPTVALNAYAAGLWPEEAVVAVTRGLLDTLDEAELEAVLAHEVAHIRNRDVQLMVVAAIFAGGLGMIGDGIARLLASSKPATSDHDGEPVGLRLPGRGAGGSGSGRGSAVLLPVLIAIAIAVLLLAATHVLSLLTRLAISRSREFMADAGAVELTKNADALISALQKISGHDEVPDLPANLRAMMFSQRAASLLSTHPPVEERIAALVTHAGGRASAAAPRAARSGAATFAPAGAVGLVGRRVPFGRRSSRA